MVTLFSCRNGGTLYHYLHTGSYVKKESTYSDFQAAVVVLDL
jgi:hypothetical protein